MKCFNLIKICLFAEWYAEDHITKRSWVNCESENHWPNSPILFKRCDNVQLRKISDQYNDEQKYSEEMKLTRRKLENELSDAGYLNLVEGFTESVPQLVLQVYIMTRTPNGEEHWRTSNIYISFLNKISTFMFLFCFSYSASNICCFVSHELVIQYDIVSLFQQDDQLGKIYRS